jgi:hypothetical protein
MMLQMVWWGGYFYDGYGAQRSSVGVVYPNPEREYREMVYLSGHAVLGMSLIFGR